MSHIYESCHIYEKVTPRIGINHASASGTCQIRPGTNENQMGHVANEN